MIKTTEEAAQDLFEEVNKQILSEILALQKRMLEKGYAPEEWAISDNIYDVIENPSIPYICTPVLKNTIKRETNHE